MLTGVAAEDGVFVLAVALVLGSTIAVVLADRSGGATRAFQSAHAPRALALVTLGAAVLAALVHANFVAAFLVLLGLALTRVPAAPGPDAPRDPPMSWPSVAALVGGVAFVLASTMARQYVNVGADLVRRPGFGEWARFGEAFGGRDPLLGLVAGLFVVLVVMLRPPDATPPRGEDA